MSKDIELKIKKLNATKKVTRDDIQSLGVEISKVYDKIFFNIGTRIGKTKLICDIVNYHQYKKVLFVNQQDIHITNFLKDLDKFGYDKSIYTCICWNSLKKYKNTEWDLVVCDEADYSLHNYLEFTDNCTYKKFFLLSGTSSVDINKLIISYGFFKWTITLKQAIDWDILPMPNVYLKKIKPSKLDKSKLDAAEKNIEYYKGKVKEKGDNWSLLNLKRKGLERKKIYEEIKDKWFLEENIFERLKDKRTVFFLPNITNSQVLGNSISSLNSKKENDALLNAFNEQKESYIISNKILVRGVNLENVEWGYFGILDLNGRSFRQAFARVLISLSPSVVIPFVENSKEEFVIYNFLKENNIQPKYL